VLVIGFNAFYLCGGVLAAWAVILTAIGIMSHDFPATKGAERAAMAVSIVLVVAAIGSAIYVGATEEEEEEGGGGQEAGVVLPL
jgi:hypothetical protein